MNRDIKKYEHGPEHLRKHYHDWWERRKDFSDRMLWLDCDRVTGKEREVSDEARQEMLKEGYQLIGEAYMIGKAFDQRWEEQEKPEEYEYCTSENVMSNVDIIKMDLFSIVDLDPVTDEYREWMGKLLKSIFCEETEAEKTVNKLRGKVNYKP